MAIRTLPSRAIADASIQAVDIANSSISKAKLDADTQLGLQQNDSIILDGTDGAGANKGDFLTLNGTDGSSSNADNRILFDETFVDKLNLFNINTFGSSGDALKVDSSGEGFEFGSAGGVNLLATTTFSSATGNVTFNNTYINSTYDYYELFYTARPSNDNVNGYFRFLNNSNTQLNSGQYDYVVHDGNGSNAGSANGGNEMGDSHSSVGNASGEGVSGRVYFGNVNETTVPCGFRNEGRCHNNGGTHTVNIVTAGLNEGNASTLVGGIVFQFSSGNIASGTFRLYGVVK